MMEALSLYELNNRVRLVLNRALTDEYWLQAELSEVRVNAAGHCYVEFVQKDSRGNALLAKARGTVWNNVFCLLRPYFERETGQAFAAGISVLVRVRVDFHELYGYSLTVTDIDPSYTVGDMARRRKEILRMLQEEGVIDLNKELEMPMVPQRVAVISSPTAAGYGDFCDQLARNLYGYVFRVKLFPAIMQGDRVENSILEALDKILSEVEKWDVVVIIRGGGAVSDLTGFDTYMLAASCAQFPLPIITGIGHERDDTVLDMVAHTRVKTPTAAAEYLIGRVHEAADGLDTLVEQINLCLTRRLEGEKQRLNELARRLPELLKLRRMYEENRWNGLWQRIRSGAVTTITKRTHHLEMLEQRVKSCDPQMLLSRGFSLTMKEGRAVTDASDLKEGDVLVTRFAKGEVTSVVTPEPLPKQ